MQFVQWQFDERLQRGMKSVIQQMQYSALTYGRSIQEIDWQIQDGGVYAGKVVINDIWDRDPDRFVISPKGYKPGLYLKKSVFSNVVDESDILPARKFVVMTNRKYFENQYGISELRPLDPVSEIMSKIWGFWGRGLEKAGKGSIRGKYGTKLLGKTDLLNKFLEEVAKIANETVTITHIENMIETLKPEFEAAAFSEFVNTAVQQISLVLTGSSTALIEGKFKDIGREYTGEELEVFADWIGRGKYKVRPADVTRFTTEQLAKLRPYRRLVESWWRTMDENLERRALDGEKVPGMKLVESRTNREYADEAKAADLLILYGLEEDQIYTRKLLSPTQAEEVLRNELKLPKKVAHEVLERYVRKPAGKPTLAPLSDKRPELESYEENLWDDEGMFDDDDDEL